MTKNEERLQCKAMLFYKDVLDLAVKNGEFSSEGVVNGINLDLERGEIIIKFIDWKAE